MAGFFGAARWLSVGAVGELGVIEAGGVGWFDIATDLAVSFLEQPLVPKKKTANTDVTISEPTSAAVFCLRLNFFPQNRGRWFAPRIFDAALLSDFPCKLSCVNCAIFASPGLLT
ncbi:MAG TPA: hypothetical protein VJK29_07065 [Terriglobales bacterium]|nr:hypothetical protein [Terriglobales bacterium]